MSDSLDGLRLEYHECQEGDSLKQGIAGWIAERSEDDGVLIIGAIFATGNFEQAHMLGYRLVSSWNICHRLEQPTDAVLHITKSQLQFLLNVLEAQVQGSLVFKNPTFGAEASAIKKIITAQVNQQTQSHTGNN